MSISIYYVAYMRIPVYIYILKRFDKPFSKTLPRYKSIYI